MNKVLNLISRDMSDYLTSHCHTIGKVIDKVQDGPFAGCTNFYADAPTEALLLYLKNKIEEGYNKELIPTYSFWRTYYKGQSCPPHKDRESCEVSVTLCLGKSDSNNNWGIYVEGKEFVLEEGQGVIYKGCEQEHWRNDLHYDWHTQVFLHYIEKDGKYDPMFKYDKRHFLYADPVG